MTTVIPVSLRARPYSAQAPPGTQHAALSPASSVLPLDPLSHHNPPLR